MFEIKGKAEYYVRKVSLISLQGVVIFLRVNNKTAKKACGSQVPFRNKTFHTEELRNHKSRELGNITSLVLRNKGKRTFLREDFG